MALFQVATGGCVLYPSIALNGHLTATLPPLFASKTPTSAVVRTSQGSQGINRFPALPQNRLPLLDKARLIVAPSFSDIFPSLCGRRIPRGYL